MDKKLNFYFVVSHPIQYYIPLYTEISKEPAFKSLTFFCSDETIKGAVDVQFGVNVKWDIPLLDGYEYQFLKNRSFNPSIHTGFWGLFNPSLIKELANQPKGIVVVSGWNNLTYLMAIIFGKILGHKVALRCENTQKKEQKRRNSIRRFFFKNLFFPIFDYLFYVGKDNKRMYLEYKVPEKKLVFTPYCVDNERFRNSYLSICDQRNEIRKTLQYKESDFIVLFSGKYIPVKRPLDLLKAVSIVENVKCIFIGEGECRTEMQKFIDDNNLGSRVTLTGFINQSEISKYYAISDVFVMCSESETWGLSTNEAMNFELPVVLYDSVGCSDDLLVDGENGFKVPKGNIDTLASKIAYIRDNPEFKKNAGKASLAIVNQYSVKSIVASLKKSFQ